MSGKNVAVIGAGIVGLSSAWHLQRRGARVTVIEAQAVSAGASAGNAGWVTPALTAPLAAPGMVRHGVASLFRPGSPIHISLRGVDAGLARFLLGYARNCTRRRWRRGLSALAGPSDLAFASYDVLTDAGVPTHSHEPDGMIVAFRDEGERQFMLQELRHLSVGRTPPEVRLLSGEQMRNLEPAIGPTLTHGLSLAAQRFVEPRAFTEALGAAVVGEGASLVIDTVVAVDDGRSGVRVICAEGGEQRYDTVMLACGTGVARLGRRFGVRAPMRAGRGYSFDIALEQSPRGPIYLPGARVACTPFDGRLRVVGVMDLDRPDDPLDPRRLDALVRTASRLLEGVDLDSRRSDWVGARPCTADGLPLIGFTESSRSTSPEATACGA